MTADAGFVAFLGVAAGAAVATFFSPCAYALLPGYVAYYVAESGDDSPSLSGAVARGTSASLGVAAVFTALFLAVVAAGDAVEPVLRPLEAAVGVVLIAFGLLLVADVDVGFHVQLPRRRSSVAGFFAFGALYAVAAAGCVAPLFLSVVFRSLTLPAGQAAAVLGAYAAVFGGMMLAVTVVAALGHDVGSSRLNEHVDVLVRVAGAAIALAGAVQLYIVVT